MIYRTLVWSDNLKEINLCKALEISLLYDILAYHHVLLKWKQQEKKKQMLVDVI
jgi:hypothetical protein